MTEIEVYRLDSNVREVDESASVPSEIESQQALVIGVNLYSPSFRPLNNAANDASAVARVLAEQYGFSLLPGGKPLLDIAATFDELKNVIQDSLSKGNAQTRWLFYFAGHGLVESGRMYLLPANADKGATDSYLALSWLLERCIESQVGEILLILDACFSGWAMVRSEAGAGLEDQMPAPLETRVRQLISSGNPNQPVLDAGGAQHSVFTQSLLDSLEGYSGVHEVDGRIRFAPLLDQLSLEIPQRLRAAGLQTYQQQPIGGYFSGNNAHRGFVFCSNVPRLPPDTIRDLGSLDPSRRVVGLKHLKTIAENQVTELALVTQAVQISRQYLLTGSTDIVTRSLQRFEPDPMVRIQAASTLGELLISLLKRFRVEYPELVDSLDELLEQLVPSVSRLDSLAGQNLYLLSDLPETGEAARMMDIARKNILPALQSLLRALNDDPSVTRAAAAALGRLALPVTARPLLECFLQAPDELFLDLAEAIGAIGEPESSRAMLCQALRRGKLVPLIGPDFSQELTGVKSRADFTAEFARQEGINSPTSLSLAQVAEVTTRGGQQYHGLISALKDAYASSIQNPGPLYKALSSLGAPFWLSACYDNLLTKTIDANSIVMGEDTKYWRPNRPTVVRLTGDPDSIRGLVVLEKDYELLRENEGDRKLLLGFLQQELKGKIVLFLGFDPASPDFSLLIQYILNHHLSSLPARAFQVWLTAAPTAQWGEHPVHLIHQGPLKLLTSLQSPLEDQNL
jgi:hypothetical protein